MSLIEHKELAYVRKVAGHWYKVHSTAAAQWEAVLTAETPEDLAKALDAVALGKVETNQEGEADG